MSDIITSIQQFPTVITVVEAPLNVTIAQGGVQGPQGVPGTPGTGITTGTSIFTNVVSPSYSSSGNLSLVSNSNSTGIIVSGGNLNIYGNTSGVGPHSTGFSLLTNGVVFGGLSGILGSPAGWLPIFISGTLRFIPYF